ncbi:MAG: energy-coupling factor transporter transmembrane protein EcfT [Brevinematales bacterium]|nr:energy-coupling factor transporter transmembrane protein EcfT [Brevinematales bacterium]
MRRSKLILFIMPLFLVGAFFLDLFFKILLFVSVVLFLLFYNYRLFFKAINVLLGIFVSILPFLLSIIFNNKEGKIFYFLGLKFYSLGILKSMNYLLNILSIGLFSFFIIKVLNFFEFFKDKRFYVFFMAIEFYSELVTDFFKEFKNIKLSRIIEFIDKKYKYYKNISRQSDES